MGFLDLLFPKKCVVCKKIGDYLCPKCFSYLSFEQRILYPGLPVNCYIPILKKSKTSLKLLESFKNKPYVSSLNTLIADFIYESLIQNEKFMIETKTGKWYLVAVPIKKSELRKRGFNQSELLSKEAGKRLKLKHIKALKIKDSKFCLKEPLSIEKANILLLADELRESTAIEIAKVLKEAKVQKIIAVSLIRAD